MGCVRCEQDINAGGLCDGCAAVVTYRSRQTEIVTQADFEEFKQFKRQQHEQRMRELEVKQREEREVGTKEPSPAPAPVEEPEEERKAYYIEIAGEKEFLGFDDELDEDNIWQADIVPGVDFIGPSKRSAKVTKLKGESLPFSLDPDAVKETVEILGGRYYLPQKMQEDERDEIERELALSYV